ncbi:MAG: ferredoxin [Cyanobacteria bacterium P01_D01_bin.123]
MSERLDTISHESNQPPRTGCEPELGGRLRSQAARTGYEPELGGALRQKALYVDELTCIGCSHCVYVARNTFFLEEEYGMARVMQQNGDPESIIQEAIDTCPVDCIHWVDYTDLRELERQRRFQVMPKAGAPNSHA